jgi:hypothetical protein
VLGDSENPFRLNAATYGAADFASEQRILA